MPNFTGLGSSFINVALLFIVVSALIVVGYMLWSNTRYKYKIEIFENLGGTRYVKTGVDRARVQKLGNQGEEILILKKRKKIVTSYNRKMGQNLLWFAIGQDGTWVNITLGDLDAKQGMLDIEPVDRDVRMFHAARNRLTDATYGEKRNWIEKYAPLMILLLTVIVLMVGLYIVAGKINEGQMATAEAAEINKQTIELANGVLTKIDSIQRGGDSGIVQAIDLEGGG